MSTFNQALSEAKFCQMFEIEENQSWKRTYSQALLDPSHYPKIVLTELKYDDKNKKWFTLKEGQFQPDPEKDGELIEISNLIKSIIEQKLEQFPYSTIVGTGKFTTPPLCLCPYCSHCDWVRRKCACGGDGKGKCGPCVWYQNAGCFCATANCCTACQWEIKKVKEVQTQNAKVKLVNGQRKITDYFSKI